MAVLTVVTVHTVAAGAARVRTAAHNSGGLDLHVVPPGAPALRSPVFYRSAWNLRPVVRASGRCDDDLCGPVGYPESA